MFASRRQALFPIKTSPKLQFVQNLLIPRLTVLTWPKKC